jgi:hypothetical protein
MDARSTLVLVGSKLLYQQHAVPAAIPDPAVPGGQMVIELADG